jgi:hypothetical protein
VLPAGHVLNARHARLVMDELNASRIPETATAIDRARYDAVLFDLDGAGGLGLVVGVAQRRPRRRRAQRCGHRRRRPRGDAGPMTPRRCSSVASAEPARGGPR